MLWSMGSESDTTEQQHPSSTVISCITSDSPGEVARERTSSSLSVLFSFLSVCLFVCLFFPFVKSLLNLLHYCFLFWGLFFGLEACGILTP